MQLHFDRTGVERLIEHARAATKHKPAYGQKEPVPAGLWLVGDDGVYLMSNGEPALMVGEKNFVVYARECDPTKLSFDDWWAAKRASFGGDDGVEYLSLDGIANALATYPPGMPLILVVAPTEIAIISYTTKKPAPKRKPGRRR